MLPLLLTRLSMAVMVSRTNWQPRRSKRPSPCGAAARNDRRHACHTCVHGSPSGSMKLSLTHADTAAFASRHAPAKQHAAQPAGHGCCRCAYTRAPHRSSSMRTAAACTRVQSLATPLLQVPAGRLLSCARLMHVAGPARCACWMRPSWPSRRTWPPCCPARPRTRRSNSPWRAQQASASSKDAHTYQWHLLSTRGVGHSKLKAGPEGCCRLLCLLLCPLLRLLCLPHLLLPSAAVVMVLQSIAQHPSNRGHNRS